jgi:peptide deformylase
MALRKIIEYPEPILRFKAKDVEHFDDELKVIIEDMAETMYDAPGVGLAAPQIAESLQVIVVDITVPGEEQQYMPMINPKIIERFDSQIDEEGCLSVPDITAKVERYKKITVHYLSEDGTKQALTTEDRFAVVLQHEIDHLNGILFIDHLSPLKRNLYKKKRKKMLAEQES